MLERLLKPTVAGFLLAAIVPVVAVATGAFAAAAASVDPFSGLVIVGVGLVVLGNAIRQILRDAVK